MFLPWKERFLSLARAEHGILGCICECACLPWKAFTYPQILSSGRHILERTAHHIMLADRKVTRSKCSGFVIMNAFIHPMHFVSNLYVWELVHSLISQSEDCGYFSSGDSGAQTSRETYNVFIPFKKHPTSSERGGCIISTSLNLLQDKSGDKFLLWVRLVVSMDWGSDFVPALQSEDLNVSRLPQSNSGRPTHSCCTQQECERIHACQQQHLTHENTSNN